MLICLDYGLMQTEIQIQELGFALNAVPKMKVDTAANAA